MCDLITPGTLVIALAVLLSLPLCAAQERQPNADPVVAELPPNGLWLETLDLDDILQDYSRPRAGATIDGAPITLRGVVYPHGVGGHATMTIAVDLAGVAREFRAIVGVDDETGGLGSIRVEVYVDDKLVEHTPLLTGGGAVAQLAIELTGARKFELIVDGTEDGVSSDHVALANALFILDPAAKTKPRTVRLDEPTMPMAMAPSPQTSINHPRVTGATPGRPFLFRIPASGDGPLTFAADNLPPGVTLDPKTGVLSGALAECGEWPVKVTAAGPRGKDVQTLTIVGGRRKLALTPPMGWSAWNAFGPKVTDQNIRDAARIIVDRGLAGHGYQYVNIDDYWEGERDANGEIQSDEKFPDMKALTDYVHSLGLKAGLYSSPGPHTCGGRIGSYNHELQDARTFAAWGFDYLKYDLCSYDRLIVNASDQAEQQRPYLVMRAALDAVDRDIVYSLCQYGNARSETWAPAIGADLWRTSGDLHDTWSDITSIARTQSKLAEFAGPGHWNDPDILVVGVLGWGDCLRPTQLTRNEQITHITLWSLLAAPLLVGCDLSQLDDFTFALLTNDEVIGVNQDPLGRQARCIANEPRGQVWARPLADGSTAVGLLNFSHRTATVGVTWKQLGLEGEHRVRNLWTHEDLGEFEAGYEAEIFRHGALLLKIMK